MFLCDHFLFSLRIEPLLLFMICFMLIWSLLFRLILKRIWMDVVDKIQFVGIDQKIVATEISFGIIIMQLFDFPTCFQM